MIPGAVTPVATGAVTPTAPGAPLKPAAAVPATLPKGNDKTGTTAVKTPPPKETARITVKPSLPTARPIGASSPPSAKPAVAAGAVAGAAVATAAAATPTTSVTAVKKADTLPVAGLPAYEDERSTTLTTALAGALALLTWGTAGILAASYLHYL